jgi:TolA-binding protein
MGAPYEAKTSAKPTSVQPRSPRPASVAQPDGAEPTPTPVDLAQPEAKPEPAKAPRAKAPGESLAAEQRLIAAARAALEDRDGAERALELVERHARDFPEGQMAEDASIYRAQALCKLGRLDEARAEARRFRDRWPDSQHRARMLRLCVQRPTGR